MILECGDLSPLLRVATVATIERKIQVKTKAATGRRTPKNAHSFAAKFPAGS
jgi:hypothetical protein